MGDFDRLNAPSTSSGAVPPVPDMKLSRPSLLGPAEGSATLDGFALGKADLTPQHRKQLADLATSLKRLISEPPGGRVQAIGHTDKVSTKKATRRSGNNVRTPCATSSRRTASMLQTSARRASAKACRPSTRRTPSRAIAASRCTSSPNSSSKYPNIMSGGLKRPTPPVATPPPKIPGFDTQIDFCKLFPDECDPNRISPDIYKPIPPAARAARCPVHRIDVAADRQRAEARAATSSASTDTWNKRLRDARRPAAKKGAEEGLDEILDAAGAPATPRRRRPRRCKCRGSSAGAVPMSAFPDSPRLLKGGLVLDRPGQRRGAARDRAAVQPRLADPHAAGPGRRRRGRRPRRAAALQGPGGRDHQARGRDRRDRSARVPRPEPDARSQSASSRSSRVLEIAGASDQRRSSRRSIAQASSGTLEIAPMRGAAGAVRLEQEPHRAGAGHRLSASPRRRSTRRSTRSAPR